MPTGYLDDLTATAHYTVRQYGYSDAAQASFYLSWRGQSHTPFTFSRRRKGQVFFVRHNGHRGIPPSQRCRLNEILFCCKFFYRNNKERANKTTCLLLALDGSEVKLRLWVLKAERLYCFSVLRQGALFWLLKCERASVHILEELASFLRFQTAQCLSLILQKC